MDDQTDVNTTKVVRLVGSGTTRPTDVVMICLVVMTVGGGLMLLSAAEPTAPVDGAIEWQEQSPLRAVTALLCLNYQFPTYYAGAVKNYILGLGTGLALLALAVAIVARGRTRDEDALECDADVALSQEVTNIAPAAPRKTHIAPLVASQVLVGLYLLWSFASSRWSSAPDMAIGASLLLTIHFLWALAIGHGLSVRGAVLATRAFVIVSVAAAVVTIWYHYGRKPLLRAEFPIGNPTFTGACLIPGILLALGTICARVASVRETPRSHTAALALLAGGAVLACSWAFLLADSRGPYAGLLFGALSMAFFALRGWRKWIPLLFALAIAVGGWLYIGSTAQAYSPTGRGPTLRLRLYAWSYAWRMFTEKPFTGHGQGGFVRLGDSYAHDDVLADPLVFDNRIAHAHNEWLEVLADLGSVGLVLIVSALLLTLRAGAAAIAARPPPQRWAVIALMGSLVGLVVEESFGVGLRVSAVGTVFCTVIGLIWSLSSAPAMNLAHRLSATTARRLPAGIAGGLAGLAVMAIVQQEFSAARSSHRAEEMFLAGDHESAVRLAAAAAGTRFPLNPQRALVRQYRLAEAHLAVAQYLQARAIDRMRRAQQTDPPSRRLGALAIEDFRLSDLQSDAGRGAIKEVVVRSPGFLNHGRLAYRLNLTRARSAAARGDLESQQALMQHAVVAIQRELARQPFDPGIAVDLVRSAGPTLDLEAVIEILARPLRHHRITNLYVEMIRDLAGIPQFEAGLSTIVIEATLALHTARFDEAIGEPVETWAPEKLRLAAAYDFLRGNYHGAVELLERAAPAYESLRSSAPLGAASCYAELADCRFFDTPTVAGAALAAAGRVLQLAPQSRDGRLLADAIKSRMIGYHLADDDEQQAHRLLREAAGTGATDEDVLSELGLRYRRLCESLIEGSGAGGTLPPPPAALGAKLEAWIHRAIKLNPKDPNARYVAADLAYRSGDHAATAEHLRHAIEHGMPASVAREFLGAALSGQEKSPVLQSLWDSLSPPEQPEGAASPRSPSSNRRGL